AHQQRSPAVPGTVRVKRVHSRRIRRLQHLERLASEVHSKFERMPSTHHRKGIEILGNGSPESRIGAGRWPDLLIARHRKDWQHGCERIRWNTRYGDVAILQRRLVQTSPRVAEARLVQHRWRKTPIALRDKLSAAAA